MFLRNCIPIRTLNGVDLVRLEWNEGREMLCIPVDKDSGDDNDVNEQEKQLEEETNEQEGDKSRKDYVGYNDNFVMNVLGLKFVQKPFGNITMKQHMLRMRGMVMQVLNATVDDRK